MLCRTAQRFQTRPSELLGMDDPYAAYCLDEAGAWLLGQKEAPKYGGGGKKRSLNHDKKALAELARAGGLKLEGGAG